MKTSFLVLLTALSFLLFSCEKDKSNNAPESGLTLKASYDEYQSALNNRGPENSDPFTLNSVRVEGDSVIISVSYAGGCEKHFFEVVWDSAILYTNPPKIELIVLHNANGDHCEAYITEELMFSLDDLNEQVSPANVSVGVSNGSDNSDPEEYEGTIYPFSFNEGETCTVEVTALHAICGTGLYGSIWFALNDSVSTGIEDFYFKKYLQPVAVDQSLSGFRPVSGKRYKVGARIATDVTLPDVVTCMAYAGPSVPVKIFCIQEVK
jgi:hypothetical protein